MKLDKPVIFWELNELNFDLIEYYISKEDQLPNFKSFIKKNKIVTTSSEKEYEYLEPWIQWPSIRTGKTFSEHNVFRLGDIVNSGVKQHWEILEDKGYSVGAVSPINAVNRTKKAKYWIPDPWTDTESSKDWLSKGMTDVLRQTINDNAQGRITLKSVFLLLFVFLTMTRWKNWSIYFKDFFCGVFKKKHWSKGIFFERLLCDFYLKLLKKRPVDFSVFFTNMAAHFQHHYYFNSRGYMGESKNPDWYISENTDPLVELLLVYDDFLGELIKKDKYKIIIATGLRQVPFERLIYYWRLKNHGAFLNKLNIGFKKVLPRMTRDFLIEFQSAQDADRAEKILSSMVSESTGVRIFEEIENRGSSLFVILTYPREIQGTGNFKVIGKDRNLDNFQDEVVFVAIKNGHHDSLGYVLGLEHTSLKHCSELGKIWNCI